MSLQVWLPLNGSLENKGLSDLAFSVVNATNTTIVNDGKIAAQSYSNNSRFSGGIVSNNQLNINKTISIFAWIKYTSRHSNPMGIGGMHTISGSSYPAGTGMGMQIIQNPSNTSQNVLAVSTGDGSGRTWNVYYSKTPLVANTWYHVGFTYDGTKIKFYVNGAWDEKVITYTNQHNIADYVHLFAWSQDGNSTKPNTYSGDYKFNGYINDFRIYDHCLSPREVKLLAQGLCMHFSFSDPTIEGTTNLLNGAWTHTNYRSLSTGAYSSFTPQLNGGAIEVVSFDNQNCLHVRSAGGNNRCYQTLSTSASKTYTISVNYYSTRTQSGLRLERNGGDYSWAGSEASYTTPGHWQRLSITVTNTTATTFYIFICCASGTDVYVNDWQVEEKDHATPYTPSVRNKTTFLPDLSGHNHHGTLQGSLQIRNGGPRYSYCTHFNGSDTGIQLPYKTLMQNLLSNTCTINFWAQETNVSSRSIYFGGYNGSNFNIEQESGQLRVYWNNSPDIHAGRIVSNTWAMYTVVINKATGFKMFKNGALIYHHNAALTDITTGFTNNNFHIGRDTRTGDTMFAGDMSDFRIYATAFSDPEVAALYNGSISFMDNGSLQASEIIEVPDNFKFQPNGVVATSLASEIGYTNKMKIKTLSDGSAWARIYWLDVSTNATYFANTTQALECTNQTNRFSLMKFVDKFKSIANKYEFMLTYPALSSGYNRWTQTSSPNDSSVTGYNAVGTQSWSEHNSGLRKHGTSCVYNCDSGGTWYAPIGQTGHGNWNGAGSMIPAANGANTSQTELWVRIDNLPALTKLSMLEHAIQVYQIYEL